MKGLKKILTGILAGAMALSLTLSAGTGIAAKAAADGSITVQNTTRGLTYKLYKVFDATYSGTNVAYTYTKKGDNDAFYDALIDSKSPFTLEGSGPYNVLLKEGKEGDVIDFIKKYGPQAETETDAQGNVTYKKDEKGNQLFTEGYYGNYIASKEGDGKAITFSNLDYGYYFVTSGLGAIVSIDNALKDATIIDKNQTTDIDKQQQNDGETEWKYVGNGKVEDTVPTQMVGKKVNYKVVGVLSQYPDKTKPDDYVTNYVFTDTLDKGLTYNADLVVKIDGVELTEGEGKGYTVSSSVDADTKKTTTVITIPMLVDTKPTFKYNADAKYEITYSATINEDALGLVKNNEIILTDGGDKTFGTDNTKVVDYQVSLKKIDKTTKAPLAGAKFKLYTAGTNSTEIGVVLVSGTGDETSTVDNVYRVAKEGETAVVEKMVTGKTGLIVVKGLKNGSYEFEETDAPKGYNKLTARTEVVTITNANATIDVENSTGVELPSTGGIGTTIFYIIGGLLIVAAVVFFVVRRKADAE